MARPRVEAPKITISARVPPEIHRLVREAAKKCGMDLSVYLCSFWADPSNSVGHKPSRGKPRKTLAPAVVLDADLRRELANIGNNINQVARVLNASSKQESTDAYVDFLGRMIEAQRDLHRLVELLSMPKGIRNDD